MFPIVMLLLIAPALASAQTISSAEKRALRRTPVVEVFERSRDAVVNISSTEIVTVRSRSPFDSMFDDFFDLPTRSRERQVRRTSVGSGFVIHPDGYIVTNAHVVSRTAERKVSFSDGREFDAQVIAADASRDLAILKIDSDASLPTLPLGRSNDLMVGETVIAIGNPLGYQHTVTSGVVSAIDREISINQSVGFTGLIQTDASINPGNSGGPLLNVLGELIGVNTAIRGDAQNIGFAIPVDQLREVLPDLLDVERRYRIDFGMKVGDLDQPRVVSIRADSPADRAGIQPGDVLVALDGTPIHEGIDFAIALIDHQPGDTIRLTLAREGDQFDAAVELLAVPEPDGDALAAERLGVEVHPLSADVARELRLREEMGLIVTRVESGSPAEQSGIQPRDILLAIDRHYLTTIEDLGRLLEPLHSGEVITVRVLRVDRFGKIQRAGPLRVR